MNSLTYAERDAVLVGMGFACYREYLESDLWVKIRGRVLKDRNTCKVCRRPAKVVHHRV